MAVKSGFTPEKTALLQTWMLAALVMSFPFLGRLADHCPRMILLPAAAALSLMGAVIIGDFSTGLRVVVGSSAVVIAAATLRVVLGRFSEGLVPKSRLATATTINHIVENLSVAITLAIALVWMDSHARVLIALDASTTALALLAVFFLFREAKMPGETKRSTSPILGKEFFRDLAAAFVKNLGVVVLLLVFFQEITLQPLLMEKKGLDMAESTIVLNYANIGVIILSSFTILKIKKVRDARPIVLASVGSAICCVGQVLTTLALNNLQIIIGSGVFAVGEALLLPAATALVLREVQHLGPSSASSISLFITRGSLAVSPLVSYVLVSLPIVSICFWLILMTMLGAGLLAWSYFVQLREGHSVATHP